MSIYVYSGVPGSGKTYHAVRDMRFNGAPVITNINATTANTAVLPLSSITPELLTSYSHHYFTTHKYRENALLLVIDEAQLLFNSRTWNDDSRFRWLEFLSQHRKFGYRIILVCQAIDMIDKQFRCLVEFDVRHKALSNVSLFFRAVATLGFRLTCANTYYYGTDVRISRSFYPISRRTYRFYDTSQDASAAFVDAAADVSPITTQLRQSGTQRLAPRGALAWLCRQAKRGSP